MLVGKIQDFGSWPITDADWQRILKQYEGTGITPDRSQFRRIAEFGRSACDDPGFEIAHAYIRNNTIFSVKVRRGECL